MCLYDQSSSGLKCLPVISPPLEEPVNPRLFMSWGKSLAPFPSACRESVFSSQGSMQSCLQSYTWYHRWHEVSREPDTCWSPAWFLAIAIAVVFQSFSQVQVTAALFSLSVQHCPSSRPDPDPFIAAVNLAGLQDHQHFSVYTKIMSLALFQIKWSHSLVCFLAIAYSLLETHPKRKLPWRWGYTWPCVSSNL